MRLIQRLAQRLTRRLAQRLTQVVPGRAACIADSTNHTPQDRRRNTDAAATLPIPSLVSQTLAATLLFLCGTTVRAAEHIGGHNSQVQAAECTIATVFTKLQEIKTADACTSGCAGGECPDDWYPSEADACSVECGQIFEPFCARCLPLMCLGTAPSPQSHSACGLCLPHKPM